MEGTRFLHEDNGHAGGEKGGEKVEREGEGVWGGIDIVMINVFRVQLLIPVLCLEDI